MINIREEKTFSAQEGQAGKQIYHCAWCTGRGEMKRAEEALIVIDMLNDFCTPGASLFVPDNLKIIPNIAREIKHAREAKVPVIYLCDTHAANDMEFKNWPAHAVGGTEGAQVVEELAPLPGDIMVEKYTLLGFYKTKLGDVLEARGIKKVTITGCLTNICVMYVATEAVVRGYLVRIIKDCVAAVDPEMHDFALKQMEQVLKAEIV